MINTKKQQGFTLIELILYVALVSIFVSGAIRFGWDIIYSQVKASVERELHQNMRLASKRISYEIRNASDINSVSASEICLASATAARNPTRFYLSSGQIRVAWGGGTTNCTSMTNDQPLTSQDISVTTLSFTDLSSLPESQNVEFSITAQTTADRQEWQASQTYTTSVEVRTP